MSRDFGRSDVSHLVCAYLHVLQQILVAVCRSSCSATRFSCRWLPDRNGLQSATVYRIDMLLLVCTTSATVFATDRHDFGVLIWKHVCTQKISTQSSKIKVSCRSLYATLDDGDAIVNGELIAY